MTEYNWSELMGQAGEGFQPLPVSDYDLQCIKAEAKQTSNGKLMFACVYQVQGGAHHGRQVWNNYTLSPENPNALRFFFDHLAAHGITAEVFSQQPPLPPEHIAQMLVGRPIRVHLKQKTHAGSIRNEVEKIYPQGATAAAVGGGIATQSGMPQIPGVPVAPGFPAAAPQVPAPAAAPMPPVPAPAAPAPAPQPQYHVDPATGQRWDGTQWLPPEAPAAAPPPPPPPPPPVPAAPPVPPAAPAPPPPSPPTPPPVPAPPAPPDPPVVEPPTPPAPPAPPVPPPPPPPPAPPAV